MPVSLARANDVVTLTIDAGAEANAFDIGTVGELNARLAEFDADPAQRVAVITGSRGDFGTSAPVTAQQALARFWDPRLAPLGTAAFSRTPGYLHRPVKPVVAAVTGRCFGVGLICVGHLCDVRIAGESARFGFDELARGIGGSALRSRLHRQIPHTALMWMAVAGGELDAREAWRVGLVNEVVPDAEVLPRALALARSLAEIAPLASIAEKQSLQVTDGLVQGDLSFFAASVGLINRLHPDVSEGVAAFNEKRQPRYRGVGEGS